MAGRGGCCLPKTVLGSGFILFVVGVKKTTLAAIVVMEAVAIAALVAAAVAIATTAAGLLVEAAVLGKVLGLATILPVARVDARAKGSGARMEVTVSGAVVRVVAVMKTLATMPYGGSCRGAGGCWHSLDGARMAGSCPTVGCACMRAWLGRARCVRRGLMGGRCMARLRSRSQPSALYGGST